jgi:hypothetical protein
LKDCPSSKFGSGVTFIIDGRILIVLQGSCNREGTHSYKVHFDGKSSEIESHKVHKNGLLGKGTHRLCFNLSMMMATIREL